MANKGFWFVLAGLCASTVLGQAQRTFVSTSGSDANTASLCSVANPCRGFAAALTVTNSGGEVVVLSSGGYGPFTVDESVAIVSPPGVYTGISVFSGDGITVNAPGAAVVLRGLTINNQGSLGSGILVAEVGALYVESCVVNGFSTIGSGGIQHLSSGKLFVKDSIARNNSYGILVDAPSATSAEVSVDRTRVENNAGEGILLIRARGSISASAASGNGGAGIVAGTDAFVAVTDCVASRNSFQGVQAYSSGRLTARGTTASENGSVGFVTTSGAQLNVEGSTASGNGVGVMSFDASSVARVSNSVVTNNTTGFFQGSSGVLESRENNTVRGNGTDTSGTITPISGN